MPVGSLIRFMSMLRLPCWLVPVLLLIALPQSSGDRSLAAADIFHRGHKNRKSHSVGSSVHHSHSRHAWSEDGTTTTQVEEDQKPNSPRHISLHASPFQEGTDELNQLVDDDRKPNSPRHPSRYPSQEEDTNLIDENPTRNSPRHSSQHPSPFREDEDDVESSHPSHVSSPHLPPARREEDDGLDDLRSRPIDTTEDDVEEEDGLDDSRTSGRDEEGTDEESSAESTDEESSSEDSIPEALQYGKLKAQIQQEKEWASHSHGTVQRLQHEADDVRDKGDKWADEVDNNHQSHKDLERAIERLREEVRRSHARKVHGVMERLHGRADERDETLEDDTDTPRESARSELADLDDSELTDSELDDSRVDDRRRVDDMEQADKFEPED
jgi:FtsZ-binding cell division protein ZapB